MDFVEHFPQKTIFRNVLKSKRLCLYLIISFAKTLFQKYHQPIKNSRNLLQSPGSSLPKPVKKCKRCKTSLLENTKTLVPQNR